MIDKLTKQFQKVCSNINNPKIGLGKSHVQQQVCQLVKMLAVNDDGINGYGARDELDQIYNKAESLDLHTRFRVLVQMCDAALGADGQSLGKQSVVFYTKEVLREAVDACRDQDKPDGMISQLLNNVAQTEFTKSELRRLEKGESAQVEGGTGPVVVVRKKRKFVKPDDPTPT